MRLALRDPDFGYYTRADPARPDPFGVAGDFITAPEISQMFGELIGVFCADFWQRLGAPGRINLIELGPGRGTLMRDLLRAAKALPDFFNALKVHLLEISPSLRARQGETLRGFDLTWIDDLSALPDGPMLLIANEFFDALPIRQFVRHHGEWRERLIGANAGGFEFVPASKPSDLPEAPAQSCPEGGVIEICGEGRELARGIGQRLRAFGGAALIVDYGFAAEEFGGTLQAVKAHRFHSPLESPGEADLTAHVDFAALARAAGVSAFGPIPQGAWLERMGIHLRAANLRALANDRQATEIDQAVQRLIAPEAMGSLFKVLALTHPDAGPPAGFADGDQVPGD